MFSAKRNKLQLKQRYDLNKILKKEGNDFVISGICPSFNSPDSVYLADRNNCNLKEVNLRNLQSRIVYDSQQKRIRCLCPFKAPSTPAALTRLAVCQPSEMQVAIICSSADGTFREETFVPFTTIFGVLEIGQLSSGALIINCGGVREILKLPFYPTGDALPQSDYQLPIKTSRMQIVRYSNEKRVLFTSDDNKNRVYSFYFEGQKKPVQKNIISLQNKVDQLLWDEKTQQLLLQTEKSVESYRAGSSIDELLHNGSVLQIPPELTVTGWCALPDRDSILVLDGEAKSFIEFEWT